MKFELNTLYENLAADETDGEFIYLIPAMEGEFWICDCWSVNRNGVVNPEMNVCATPFRADNLGEIIERDVAVIGIDENDSDYAMRIEHHEQFQFPEEKQFLLY